MVAPPFVILENIAVSLWELGTVLLGGLLGGKAEASPAPTPKVRVEPTIARPPGRRPMRIKPEVVAQSSHAPMTNEQALKFLTQGPQNLDVFRPSKPAPNVVPNGATVPAMDASIVDFIGAINNAGNNYGEGLVWLGFPYLSELTQRAEYRNIVTTLARDMTRKWITIEASGDKSKDEKIRVITQQVKKHRLKEKFRRLAELDGFFGRAHLYVDTGVSMDDTDLLKVSIIPDAKTFERGMLRDIRVVEPVWVYPGNYNSSNPLDRGFYKPTTWYVMQREIHRTRLLTFVSREMPDLLKPAYQFGGLSMSQMAMPYVQNWLRTRQSVSDLLHSFSVMVLKTNMEAALNDGGGEAERHRAVMFNNYRDNNGLFMIDKETEDFANVATSLSTLDHLQAQSQEHMASVSGIPLVVLTGITPSGLNATSEGELQAWAQAIHSLQEHLFGDHLNYLIDLIQLDQFGEIDPSITYKFEPLKEETDAEKSAREKSEADTDNVYVSGGILAPEEIREKLATDVNSRYAGIDLSGPAPEPPELPAPDDEADDATLEGPENRAALTKQIAAALAERARANGVTAEDLEPPVVVPEPVPETGPVNRVRLVKQIAAALVQRRGKDVLLAQDAIAELPGPLAPKREGYLVRRSPSGNLNIYGVFRGQTFSLIPGEEHHGLADGWYDLDMNPISYESEL